MRRFLVLFCLLLALGPVSFGQEEADTVSARLIRQLQRYPQEKIHLQTDKLSYLSGERVWLRPHLVTALDGRPSKLSRYVYVELLNPFNELITRIQLRPDSLGVHAGYLDLDEALPEGDYTLRAYTRYMMNEGEEAFCKKKIQVLDPYSLQLEPIAAYQFSERGIELSLRFRDRESGGGILPEAVTLTLPGKPSQRPQVREGSFLLRLPKSAAGQPLLLGLSRSGRRYQRYLRVPWPEGEFDVALLPEGGYLVPGRPCRVGVKAIRPDGLGVPVTGTVYDRDGQEVARFNARSRGMGVFIFKPAAGMSYYVECTSAEGAVRRFDLPLAEPAARVLQLISAGPQLHVSLLMGPEAPETPLSLLVHRGGIPLLHQALDLRQKVLALPISELPPGLLQFVLLDEQERILSERLYFHPDTTGWIRPALSPTEPLTPRAPVRLRFQATEGGDGGARLAVSVVDGESAVPDREASLASTLWLSSELQGPIERPADYFTPDGQRELDALMLTQGWRRYDLPAVLEGRIRDPEIAPERWQEISGQSDPMIFASMEGGRISLFATLDSLTSVETTVPDKEGRFCFRTEFPEGTEVTVQGQTRRGGKGTILAIDPAVYPATKAAALPMAGLGAVSETSDAYMRRADEAYYLEHGDRSTLLEAAVVMADRVEQGSDSPWYSPITASQPLTAAQIEERHFTSILSVYLSTAGLAVRQGSEGAYLTTTRSDQPVLPVIDNVVLPEFDLMLLSPEDIDNLFVIKDNTAMFGYYPGYTGALVITTAVGFNGTKKSDNISRVKPIGYQLPAAFYSPKYETEESRNSGPQDLRTTLYWNPSVPLSPSGEVELDFYAGDRPTPYVLTGEGVSANGRIVRLEATLVFSPGN